MVDKYNGNSCKNARIKIDYNGLKPKVKFSYPDKKNQQNYSMFPTILIWWMVFLVICFYGYIFIVAEEELELNNQTVCENHYLNKSIWYQSHYLNQSIACGVKEDKSIIKELLLDLKELFIMKNLLILLFCILPPFLVYYPFKKYWKNVFPKYQARGKRCKFVNFKPKDICKEDNYYFVEVPLFNNIVLEYEAKKDFSKYLSYFEIREHNFKNVTGRTIKKAMKSKKKVNESLWYARFYFSKKPTNGKLEVKFK